ncbi:GNAT family N-acetyltransferase [Streptomyces sp. NPDC096934]|uniref:GNAT family N-acetyltransferase n=1 Tax=Streptomyces sp. NPDC096934 TaxID=3155551 RepID=UPI00331CEE56
MPDVSVRLVDTADRPVLERLWLMFGHDLSQFDEVLPNADGTFRTDRLDSALTDPDWAAYLVTVDARPAGLAFVRALSGPKRVLNSFFIVRGARKKGIGLKAAQQVIARHHGHWEVAFQDSNTGAVHFWRRVATEITGVAWTEEHRPVPHRPDLPPDAWISFDPSPGNTPRQ